MELGQRRTSRSWPIYNRPKIPTLITKTVPSSNMLPMDLATQSTQLSRKAQAVHNNLEIAETDHWMLRECLLEMWLARRACKFLRVSTPDKSRIHRQRLKEARSQVHRAQYWATNEATLIGSSNWMIQLTSSLASAIQVQLKPILSLAPIATINVHPERSSTESKVVLHSLQLGKAKLSRTQAKSRYCTSLHNNKCKISDLPSRL